MPTVERFEDAKQIQKTQKSQHLLNGKQWFLLKKRLRMDKAHKYILWFDEIGIHDVPYVGGKNASLGEMYNALRKKGIRIPNGFAVTAAGYRFLLEEEGIKKRLFEILKRINPRSVESLTANGNEA